MNKNTPSRQLRVQPALSTLLCGIFLVILFACATTGRAASGVWTNDTSSVWSASTNWLNGTVADGSGNTADFTLDNSNADTVTMDASHSLGTLLFGNNATLQTNRWNLNASGGSILTLAGGSTIAVSNGVSTNTAVVSLPLAGTARLDQSGQRHADSGRNQWL